MPAPLWGTQLTDMWMANPTMFDPTQRSNQFSNYNNQRMPYPPTYNGVPVSAATGQPIQSFLDWQKANPGGVTLNTTPTAPAAPPAAAQAPSPLPPPGGGQNMSSINQQAGRVGYGPELSWAGGVPNPQAAAAAPAAAQPQASGPPNDWQAAINALANPGNPRTMGATVPLQTGFQPSGGVNQAFLNQAGPGMNQNFLSALRAIQGRPQ